MWKLAAAVYSDVPTGVDAQRSSESPAPIQSGPRPCAGDGHLSVGFVFRQIDEVDIRERNMPESDSSRPQRVKFTRMAVWHGCLHEKIIADAGISNKRKPLILLGFSSKTSVVVPIFSNNLTLSESNPHPLAAALRTAKRSEMQAPAVYSDGLAVDASRESHDMRMYGKKRNFVLVSIRPARCLSLTGDGQCECTRTYQQPPACRQIGALSLSLVHLEQPASWPDFQMMIT